MFKIGEFSRLCQVPIKTLRYYDELGLLQPASVEEGSGYRYYSLDQLPRVHMLLALKDLGFSLEQVGRMLDDHLSLEQVRGMLRLKQAEIEGRVQEQQARLARVEHRLGLLEKEGRMPRYEVVIKTAEPMRVAAVRGVVANYGSVHVLFDELFGELGKAGLSPVGPALAIYYDDEYKEQDVDVEAAVPVAAETAPPMGRVKLRELPAYEQVASLVRSGPYDDFTPAYQELMAWIQSNGYRIIGPNREIYLQGPGQAEPAQYVTEILFPVTRA